MKRLFVLSLLALPAFGQETPIHLFHASAAVVGTEGLVVLPESGGVAEKTLRDYDDGTVRFSEAVSSVRGTMEGGVAVTVSSITINDLDILNGLVHADRLTVRATARQRLDEPEGQISFEGSSIAHLVVRGEARTLVVDTRRFDRNPTFAAFSHHARGDDDAMTERAGAFSGSIIRDWIIPIDGIGTLYLGHVTVKPGTRELAMIRFVPANGKGPVTIGRNEMNGVSMP
jgi:hypothetical protein